MRGRPEHVGEQPRSVRARVLGERVHEGLGRPPRRGGCGLAGEPENAGAVQRRLLRHPTTLQTGTGAPATTSADC
ncbi:hypothetical protein [Streptomyces europaeiscabiei]|uniref:hypothetical protein n=1 Tax=Streptomyces europaeiscabiei TaxID=146819 RepID=UPI002E0F372B|nr:hypothetical protein OHB30_05930 [Streptomyces europaeiscabiei]